MDLRNGLHLAVPAALLIAGIGGLLCLRQPAEAQQLDPKLLAAENHRIAVIEKVKPAIVAVFSGYIIYDMNRLAQTKFATEGDAIMFAVGLYLDLLNIFLALLQLLSILSGGGGGGRKSDW